jgi:hypothetical protein
MKKISVFLFLFALSFCYSQEIIIKDNAFYQNNILVRNSQMKTVLASNIPAQHLYKSARKRQSIGGLLIGFGAVSCASDLVKGLVSDEKYPSVMTYVGAGSIIASIPFLTGNKKRIHDAISMYNEGLKNTGNSNIEYEVSFLANTNGYGFQVRF